MEITVSIVLAVATLAFVLAPLLWPAPPARQGAVSRERWLSLPQLELDRALGKIDELEFAELRERAREPEHQAETIPGAAVPNSLSIEDTILAFRHARQLDRSVEAEILIQRARVKPSLDS